MVYTLSYINMYLLKEFIRRFQFKMFIVVIMNSDTNVIDTTIQKQICKLTIT